MRHIDTTTCNRHGLSIIEVLVAITIVILLAAILFPAVLSTRQAARRTQCMNKMRQIGLGFMAYSDARSGEMPDLYSLGSKQEAWIDALAPFMEDSALTRVCPNDANAAKHLSVRGTSYALNGYLLRVEDVTAAGCVACHGDSEDYFSNLTGFVTDRDSIRALSKTISFVEGKLGAEHVDSFHWFRFGGGEEAFSNISNDVAIDRHHDASNFLFVDGHVETVASARVREWSDLGDFMVPNNGQRFQKESIADGI